MAYFANSTEDCLSDQCAKCKYGEKACPIFFVQFEYNYQACNNETARKILDTLIADDGTCAMWTEFKEDFGIDPDQLKLDL